MVQVSAASTTFDAEPDHADPQGLLQSILGLFQGIFNAVYSVVHAVFSLVFSLLESVGNLVGQSVQLVFCERAVASEGEDMSDFSKLAHCWTARCCRRYSQGQTNQGGDREWKDQESAVGKAVILM